MRPLFYSCIGLRNHQINAYNKNSLSSTAPCSSNNCEQCIIKATWQRLSSEVWHFTWHSCCTCTNTFVFLSRSVHVWKSEWQSVHICFCSFAVSDLSLHTRSSKKKRKKKAPTHRTHSSSELRMSCTSQLWIELHSSSLSPSSDVGNQNCR